MARVCELCGKKTAVGKSVSHSHRVTNREFKPNIVQKKITINGETKRRKVCTRCLKKSAMK